MKPFDAVLVVAFGGPGGPADIRPFLANVLRGRRVAPERVEEVAHHYEHFGGVSPLTAITRRQADGLRDRLHARGIDVPVYLGMRNWHPLLPDTLREMSRAGMRRAMVFVCAAHRSYSSCTQYRQNVADARATILKEGLADVDVVYVNDWHTRAGFIGANSAHVRAAFQLLPVELRPVARLVFTAHSIPLSMPGMARYLQQLKESASLVAADLRHEDWALVFQSRSGRPEDPWLEPDVCQYLRSEKAQGLRAAVLCPIGFLCDHIEVLYDLDHEARAVAQEIDLPLVRAATVNDDPRFLDMMAEVVEETWGRYRGKRPIGLISQEVRK